MKRFIMKYQFGLKKIMEEIIKMISIDPKDALTEEENKGLNTYLEEVLGLFKYSY